MTTQDTQVFDYIVVGAGAAGCVVANRLSADPNRSVLLFEVGGSDDFFTATRFLDLESLFSLWGPATDWGYSTESSPGMNGRSIPITQGKVLGAAAPPMAVSISVATGATTTTGDPSATRGGPIEMCCLILRNPRTTQGEKVSTTAPVDPSQ
jgi:hypothetical protein